MTIKISQIVAMAANSRVIGCDNKLPWHLPEDLKHFKKTTIGKPVIMGRKTYESVGFPLPGRTNIVVSRQADLSIPGVTIKASCDEAIAFGKRCCELENQTELMVIGGAEIYRQTMPYVDRVYLSVVDIDVVGDAIFPELNTDDWTLASRQEFASEDGNPKFELQIFNRR